MVVAGHTLKVLLMGCGCGCQLALPVVCRRLEAGTGHTFPSLRCQPHATGCCHPVWHIVNPLSVLHCFLGIHMLFSSLTLQVTRHCHLALNSTRLFSTSSISLDSCLLGQLPLSISLDSWNCSLITSCRMILPKNLISLPTLYTFLSVLKQELLLSH